MESAKTIKVSEFFKIERTEKLLSEFASEFSYFIPEGKPESYFTLMGIKYIGPQIVILFEKKTAQLFAYNRNGKFLGKIGDLGSGPNEYKYFSDVFVFPDLNELHVYIAKQKRIIRYSTDLRLLGEIKLDVAPSTMHIYQKRFYLCAYNNMDIKSVKGEDLIVRDPISFKEVKVLQHRKYSTTVDLPENILDQTCKLFSNNDTLYYARAISGNVTVYKVFNDIVTPFLHLDFKSLGKQGLDYSMVLINHTMFFGDYLAIAFQKNFQMVTGYFNFKTGELAVFEILNDLDKGVDFYPMGLCEDGSYYSDDLNINYFTDFWKSNKNSTKYKNIKSLYPDREKWLKDTIPQSIEGNPWIMIIYPDKK